MNITLEIDGTSYRAELDDNPVALIIADALPLEVRMARWGDELYGDIGEAGNGFSGLSGLPEGREIMSEGELAYWKPGNALCVFFGPTPASTDSRPRAASAAIVIGRVTDDLEPLKDSGPSAHCRVRAAE